MADRLAAVRAAFGRRDVRVVAGGTAVAYLVVYLVATGELASGTGDVGVVVVADPLARAFQRTGTLRFESVALVDAGIVRFLFAPLNLLVGAGLAALIGANLGLSWLAWRQPRACGLGAKSGVGLVAGVPALLSGAACCAPVLLIVVGIQASSLLLLTVDVLVVLAGLALVGTLVYVAGRIDPAATTS